MEDDSGYDTYNEGDITRITWEWDQYVFDDIIDYDEEEDIPHICHFFYTGKIFGK